MQGERTESTILGIRWQMLLLVGLSLSIGWGIRGNFGHEWGAAMPGALAAMAAVLLSQREDWLRRFPYFAMFGAIGWSFGGSISYMIVISYTHSGHAPSVLYGFACLFVIGFLWGAAGGAGTALPAFLSRERLVQFFIPLTMIFLVWWAEGTWEEWFINSNPAYQKNSPLDWFDTDWISIVLSIVVILLRAAVRRKIDQAERLILYMAVGWWLGFLILTVFLGLRMTPPRGDSWAGSVGLVAGLLLYFRREKENGLIYAILVSGFVGGLGFASAAFIKLVLMKTGWDTNWHSVLEQSYGLINGLGIAILMDRLRTRAPLVSDDPPTHRWTEGFAVSSILLLLTYVNLQKEVGDWISAKVILPQMLFLTTQGWFDLFYALIAVTFLLLLREHMRRPLPLVPTNWLGKGQMIYLAFLWWIVIGNFMKALVSFSPQRLVTEGVIQFNALLCTLMVLLWARRPRNLDIQTPDYRFVLRRTLALGLTVMAVSVFLQWGLIRAIYGDTFAGNAKLHIRFGPNNTNNK